MSFRRANRGFAAAFAATAAVTAFGACSGDPSTARVEIRIAPDLEPRVARYEMRVIPGLSCADLALAGGLPDRARTATTSSMWQIAEGHVFEGIASASFVPGSVDVRAIGKSQTVLGRRCFASDPGLFDVAVLLARFLPEGARVTLTSSAALRTPTASKHAWVHVADSNGKNVENAFVSVDESRALVATDANGIAKVQTPTGTPTPKRLIDRRLSLEVYGHEDGPPTIDASYLASGACPEVAWSREAVRGQAGGRLDLAAAEDYVALLRAQSATTSAMVVEILAGDPALDSFTTLATATVGDAAVDIAAVFDAQKNELFVGVLGRDRVVPIVFAPANRSVRFLPPIVVPFLPGVALPRLSSIGFFDPFGNRAPDLFVGGIGVAGGLLRAKNNGTGGFLQAEPALLGDARNVLSITGIGQDLAVLFADELALFTVGEDRLVRAGQSASNVSSDARLLLDPVDPGHLLVFDAKSDASRAHVRTFRRTPLGLMLADETLALSASDDFARGDMNTDQNADVVLTSRGDNAVTVLLSDGRGHFVREAKCNVAGGPSTVVALPMASNGTSRFAAILAADGKIALLRARR